MWRGIPARPYLTADFNPDAGGGSLERLDFEAGAYARSRLSST